MSDTEYKSIIDEGVELKKLQDKEESPEVIATNPTLSISDIDPTPIEYPIHVVQNAFKSGIRVVTHEVASSGIAYVDFGLDLSMIPFEDAILLPSLITLLNEAGTTNSTDAEFRYVCITHSSKEILDHDFILIDSLVSTALCTTC